LKGKTQAEWPVALWLLDNRDYRLLIGGQEMSEGRPEELTHDEGGSQ